MLSDFEKLKKPEKYDSGEKKLKKELYSALDQAVKLSVGGSEKIAVAFSGGLDSSIIAYLVSKYSVPVLFCVGFKDSHDVIQARKSFELLKSLGSRLSKMSSSSKAKDPIEEDSALYNGTLRPASPELQRGEQAQSDKYKKGTFSDSLLGIKLNMIYLDDLDLDLYLEKTIELVGTDNRLITDLNVPLYIILEEIKKLGFDKLVLGQGADTMFGGFARYPYSENFGDEILQDIKNIGKTNLVYNYRIFDHFKMQPIYPFLEKEVVDIAVKADPDLKIRGGVQKYILREAFREYLPETIADLPKKSFQYGSGIHKALKKLSKDKAPLSSVKIIYKK